MASAPGGISASSPLAQPGQVLSGQSLIQAAQALADAQTQGPMTELARQIRMNNAQAQNAAGQTAKWFQSLGQFGQQGFNDVQRVGTGLNQTLAGIGQDEQSRLGQIQANATQQMAKYNAGDSSLTNPGMSALTTELARQQGLAAQNNGAMRMFGAAQGASASGEAAQNLFANQSAGQQDIANIRQSVNVKNEPLESKLAALQAQTGSLFATDLGKLRQQEITNRDTAAGLNIKQETATASLDNAATNAGKLQVDQWNANPKNVGSSAWARVQSSQLNSIKIANEGQNYAWEHDDRLQKLLQQNLNSSTPKPLPTAENDKMLKSLNQIVNTIPYLQQHGIPTKTLQNGRYVNGVNQHPTEAQIRQYLGSTDGTGGALIQAAYELLGYGFISASTAQNLKRAGVNIGAYQFRGKPVTVFTPPANTYGQGPH